MTTKLKTIFVAAGGILLLALAIIAIYATGQHRAYLISKGESVVLEQQFKDYRLTSEKEKTALTAEAIRTTAEKDAAIARANAASLKAGEIQSKLDAATALTAALPADVLSGQINARIGVNQSCPIMNGTFSFTRPGAESTLNLFLTGEASASKYAAERTVSSNLRDALTAADAGTVNVSARLSITETELTKCVAAKDATASALKHLEHSILGTKIKNFAIGVGVGAATVTVLHLLKVI